MQATRHHKVDNQPVVGLEPDDDTLAEAVNVRDLPSVRCAECRIKTPDKEWGVDPDGLEHFAVNALNALVTSL